MRSWRLAAPDPIPKLDQPIVCLVVSEAIVLGVGELSPRAGAAVGCPSRFRAPSAAMPPPQSVAFQDCFEASTPGIGMFRNTLPVLGSDPLRTAMRVHHPAMAPPMEIICPANACRTDTFKNSTPLPLPNPHDKALNVPWSSRPFGTSPEGLFT